MAAPPSPFSLTNNGVFCESNLVCFLILVRLSQLLPRIRRRGRARGPDDWEDPEALLDWAMWQLTEMHARNRDRVVQAITQKNNLQQMVNDTQRRVDNLQRKADAAEARGDRDLARQLESEKEQCAATLEMTRQILAQTIEIVDEAKAAIKREAERVQRKTAEALALKTEWRCALLTYQVEQAQTAFGETLPGASAVENYVRLRERLVKAMTARNSLRLMVNDAEKRVVRLEAKAELAAEQGDADLAKQLRRERETYAATLPGLHESAARAGQIVAEATRIVYGEFPRPNPPVP